MLNQKNKLLLIALIFLSTLTMGGGRPPVQAQVQKEAPVQVAEVSSRELDYRAQILADYFRKYNSPLETQAQDFIDAADTYGVDWKLVPSIAGVESTFGKHIPGGHGPQISYNAWGWGVYGTQSLGFKSWRDGIFTVTGGLKKNYIDKGLTDPYKMNRVYAASPTWGTKVSHFLGDLNKFSQQYSNIEGTQAVEFRVKDAGSSAQLASL